MVDRAMVGHDVDDDPDPAGAGLADQGVKVLKGAEARVDMVGGACGCSAPIPASIAAQTTRNRSGGSITLRVTASGKVALDALTRILAAELRERQIDVRAVSPGWTETRVGRTGGRPIVDGVRSVLAAIDQPMGTTDTYTQDDKPLPW